MIYVGFRELKKGPSGSELNLPEHELIVRLKKTPTANFYLKKPFLPQLILKNLPPP